ncbi:hypothetical protein [Segetibacter aerophilus]|uniref:Uncharacterized protein n=1 Tax=Segetibacter aerophilus TaxID=670293 RepID=A0A512B6C2_9BACT|nr:hypothetical protein [Segetibacter aerophilus]GEO07513.1 hypothetical protein SAE01_00090 [Segetibacter aerophilus]
MTERQSVKKVEANTTLEECDTTMLKEVPMLAIKLFIHRYKIKAPFVVEQLSLKLGEKDL